MFTLYEVADLLGLHYNTIRKAVRTGKIKAVKFGSVYKVSKEELDRITKQGF